MAAKKTKETVIIEGESTWYLRHISSAQRHVEMAAIDLTEVRWYDDAKGLNPLGIKLCEEFWSSLLSIDDQGNIQHVAQ